MVTQLELKYFPVLENDLSQLLHENFKLKKKGDIYKDIQKIKPKVEMFQKLQREFYEKHGTEKNGQYILPSDLSDELKKEFDEFQNKKEKVTITSISWKEIEDIKSNYPYYVLLKIFVK